ncbi:MAG: hypothetical protein CVU81_00570 [Euryarchaeota archaeon HGW-Euryarchaeota-1]|nr:MAG: hypothetical protein CVU81_00570 [Euryarchaeota archaeon HGW-Euryarchaeota-1]
MNTYNIADVVEYVQTIQEVMRELKKEAPLTTPTNLRVVVEKESENYNNYTSKRAAAINNEERTRAFIDLILNPPPLSVMKYDPQRDIIIVSFEEYLQFKIWGEEKYKSNPSTKCNVAHELTHAWLCRDISNEKYGRDIRTLNEAISMAVGRYYDENVTPSYESYSKYGIDPNLLKKIANIALECTIRHGVDVVRIKGQKNIIEAINDPSIPASIRFIHDLTLSDPDIQLPSIYFKHI